MTSVRLDTLESAALRAIVAVAECGTVTEAARRLRVTQPALSYQIKQLETAAGMQLFERTRRGMVPTPAGERLIRAARTVRSEIERIEDELEFLKAGAEGRLRITSECFTAYHWLASVLSAFRRSYPGVEVEVAVDPSRRPLEELRAGQVDILLTTDPPGDAGLAMTPVFDDEIVAIVPPEHPFAQRAYLRALDFAKQSVLVWSLERSDLLNLVLRPAGIRPRHLSEIPITEAMVEMVRSGLGVSAVASWSVQPELDTGELVSVRITKRGLRRRWYGVRRDTPATPPCVADFLSLLAKTLESPVAALRRRKTPLSLVTGD